LSSISADRGRERHLGLLLGGRACDLFGRRRMFMFGLALYGVASLAGGLAASQGLLIAARAVQGLGGAFLFPATLSLVNTNFAEGRDRNRALAIWATAGAGGMVLGSLLGGVLTQAFGWSAVFYVNVPLVAAAILPALSLITPDHASRAGRSVDVPGAVTATAGMTSLVFALVQAPVSGWASPVVLGSEVAGSHLGGRLATRFGMRAPLSGGLVLGAVWLGLAMSPAGSYVSLIPAMLIFSLGQGVVVYTAMFAAASAGVSARARHRLRHGLLRSADRQRGRPRRSGGHLQRRHGRPHRRGTARRHHRWPAHGGVRRRRHRRHPPGRPQLRTHRQDRGGVPPACRHRIGPASPSLRGLSRSPVGGAAG
jgi:MFS family permease